MKRIVFLLFGIIINSNITLDAQAPDAFKYQAVARNSTGNPIINQNISFRITILKGSAIGPPIYSEIHFDSTNAYGLVNLNIGNGTTADDFSAIDWVNGPYFLQIEMDPLGETNFQFMGTSQLLSVPYALHANTSEESDPLFRISTASSISETDTANWNEIKNKGMGDWVEILAENVYQASTDGFLYGISEETDRCTGHVAHVYTGSSTENLSDFFQASYEMQFIIPIRNETYFKVTITVEAFCNIQHPNLLLRWMPLN